VLLEEEEEEEEERGREGDEALVDLGWLPEEYEVGKRHQRHCDHGAYGRWKIYRLSLMTLSEENKKGQEGAHFNNKKVEHVVLVPENFMKVGYPDSIFWKHHCSK
jgi:hypothetical protein